MYMNERPPLYKHNTLAPPEPPPYPTARARLLHQTARDCWPTSLFICMLIYMYMNIRPPLKKYNTLAPPDPPTPSHLAPDGARLLAQALNVLQPVAVDLYMYMNIRAPLHKHNTLAPPEPPTRPILHQTARGCWLTRLTCCSPSRWSSTQVPTPTPRAA